MREIKFRGRNNKGKWVYGYLGEYKFRLGMNTFTSTVIFKDLEWFNTDNFSFVVKDYTVEKDTVGQFTSLKDKNGKDIYEGDIVVYNNILHGNMVCICTFDEYTSSFMLIENALPFGDSHYIHRSETKNMEVIGNIYDNDDLLKK